MRSYAFDPRYDTPSGGRCFAVTAAMSASAAAMLIVLAQWASLWAWLLVAPVSLVFGVACTLDGTSRRPGESRPEDSLPDFLEGTSVSGFLITMALVVVCTGFMLFRTPLPWWACVLFLLTGWLGLLWLTHQVRRAVCAVSGCSLADANVAALAAMVVAALWTGLSTASRLHFSAPLAVMTAAVLWVFWASASVMLTQWPHRGSALSYIRRH